MTKSEIMNLLQDVPDDSPIEVCISDSAEHLDELEAGSLLNIVDGGFIAGRHVLYVEPL